MNQQKKDINLGGASKDDLPSADKYNLCWGGSNEDHLSPEHKDALSRAGCFQHPSQQVKQISLRRGGNSKKHYTPSDSRVLYRGGEPFSRGGSSHDYCKPTDLRLLSRGGCSKKPLSPEDVNLLCWGGSSKDPLAAPDKHPTCLGGNSKDLCNFIDESHPGGAVINDLEKNVNK